jgi:hypothetical protein
MTKTIEIEIDDAREVMYDELVELLGEKQTDALLGNALTESLTDAYDQRAQLAQQIAQRR